MHFVIDQRFAVGADAFRLLRAAVSGTEAGSHDEQRRHTYVTSSSAREMFASPRSTRRGGDPKLMRKCRGDSKKRPGTTSVEYRFSSRAANASASTSRGSRGNTTLPPSGTNASSRR